ncbi:hypothetical protein BC829DRAFT_417043 [Chytridium lagenaria]|nr:hypothetical protein BC829DRAFT_417043 [Chytridium lagenaria]
MDIASHEHKKNNISCRRGGTCKLRTTIQDEVGGIEEGQIITRGLPSNRGDRKSYLARVRMILIITDGSDGCGDGVDPSPQRRRGWLGGRRTAVPETLKDGSKAEVVERSLRQSLTRLVKDVRFVTAFHEGEDGINNVLIAAWLFLAGIHAGSK